MVGRPAQSSGHSPFISVKARATGAGAPGDVLGHLPQGAAGTGSRAVELGPLGGPSSPRLLMDFMVPMAWDELLGYLCLCTW